MGPQERLIGSLVLFLYIGEEEKVGGEERLSLSLLLSPPQSCPRAFQSAPKPPQISLQKVFLHYLPALFLKNGVFVRDILKKQRQKMRMSRAKTLLLRKSAGR